MSMSLCGVRRSERGFTLVEMLTVIVVLGILSAIAVGFYLSQKQKAYDAALRSDLNNAAIVVQQDWLRNQRVVPAELLGEHDAPGAGEIKLSEGNSLEVKAKDDGDEDGEQQIPCVEAASTNVDAVYHFNFDPASPEDYKKLSEDACPF